MKRARIAYAGAIHEAVPHGDVSGEPALRLADGRVVAESAVVWLPPVEAGTVIALGLNYADHAKELAFNAQEEPLVFLKGPGTLIGHRGQTRRPAGVGFMHYECELAVVIGRPARRVRRAQAMEHVAGYTVANDYAIRDYLENWYRPNLRVKNRDGATPIGPWFVDAGDIANPMALALSTTVNGKLTQSGSTKDMIFDVPFLIEYFTSFMTLHPGDVISSGTPPGVGHGQKPPVYLREGNIVRLSVQGLGEQRQRVVRDT